MSSCPHALLTVTTSLIFGFGASIPPTSCRRRAEMDGSMYYSSPAYTIPHVGSAFTIPFGGAPTTFSTSSTSTYKNEQATVYSTSVSPSSTEGIATAIFDNGHGNFWQGLAHGAQIGVILVIIISVICVILFSMWFCCGCCGSRRCCGRKRIPPEQQSPGGLPLHTIPTPERRGRAGDRAMDLDPPPPQYEETVPPQHQTIAGGITHVREEEEGVISDGKTPLSEIPFEDVVLDHTSSEGSGSGSSPSLAREFASRHHGLGGDTRGHTNS